MVPVRWMGAVVLAIVAGTLVIAAQAGAGGTTDIAITDDTFTPDDVEDLAYRWQWDPGGDGMTLNEHNVRQDAGFFDSGTPVDSGPDFNVLLEGAGKYHYYCEVHGSTSGGMDGLVRKYIFGGLIDPGESQVVNWSGDTMDRYRYDVQYRRDGGDWKNWRKDTAKVNGKFGANDKPVNVNPLFSYEVRARTQKKNNLSKRSGYSRPFLVDITP